MFFVNEVYHWGVGMMCSSLFRLLSTRRIIQGNSKWEWKRNERDLEIVQEDLDCVASKTRSLFGTQSDFGNVRKTKMIIEGYTSISSLSGDSMFLFSNIRNQYGAWFVFWTCTNDRVTQNSKRESLTCDYIYLHLKCVVVKSETKLCYSTNTKQLVHNISLSLNGRQKQNNWIFTVIRFQQSNIVLVCFWPRDIVFYHYC